MASSPADTSAHTNAGAQRSTTPPPAAPEIKDTANGPSTPRPPSIGKNPTTGTPPSTTPDTSSSANTAPPPKTADPTPPSTRTTTTTSATTSSATNTNTTTTTTTTTTHNTTQTTPCPPSRHPQPPTQAPPTDKTTHRLHTRFTLAPCLQCLVSRHPATHAACIAQRRRGAACAACERRGEGAVCVGLRVRTAREMWEAELEVLRRVWRGEEGGCSEEEEEEEEEGEVLVQGFVVVRGSGESEESWGRKREVWRGLEGVVEGRKGRDFAPRLGVGEGVGRKEDERVRDRGLLRGGVGAVGKRSWLRRWDEEDQKHDGGGGEDGQEDAGRDPIDDLRAAASLLRSKAWRLSRTHWVEVEGAGGRKWERRERSEKEQAEWMDGLEIGKALQESRRLLLETAKWQIETGQNWRRQFMRNQTL